MTNAVAAPESRIAAGTGASAPVPALRREAQQVEAQAAAAPPASEGDVLAENGLRSPICRDGAAVSVKVRSNCAASGFTGSSAPTGDFAFDVHIDTGFAHFSNYLEAAVQDAAQWGWMALVALVRGLLVMLEWCYSLNLLAGPLLTQVAGALRSAQSALTTPGLAVVMTIASMLVVYHGLLRRRVAQTLGEALATLAMMVGGLWAIVDPKGSVGALSGWVNTASVGALGAVAAGTPEHPARTLTADLQAVFDDVVTSPWCYMEFGNVRWCRDPALLDARLRRAASRIAREDRALAASRSPTGPQHVALLGSASLLDAARDNGELFLALPANGNARNSINEAGSLLSALCGGSADATRCTGPTAAEADFRTQHGTWPRIVGLLMIWMGACTMLLLFGWIGVRLLAAAVLSLLLLLLAPAAVLAPALGDGGRGFFCVWAARLLAALTAKLVYSLLLGAALLLTDLLTALGDLGWWVQWALISAGWWLSFHERHHLLSVPRVGGSARGTRGERGAAGAAGTGGRRGALRRARQRALYGVADAAVAGAGRWAKTVALPSSTAPPQRRARVVREARERVRALAGEQVAETLEHDRRDAIAIVAQAPSLQASISATRTQLARVQRAQQAAEERHAACADRDAPQAAVELRRAARLAARAERLETAITLEQGSLIAARRFVGEQQRAREQRGGGFSEAQLRERARFLDEQARLPDKGRPNAQGERRDYRLMAALARESERDWDELGSERRHRAMLTIDDELATRAGLAGAARAVARAGDGAPWPAERADVAWRAHETLPRSARSPHARSSLSSWLDEERRAARGGGPAPTLAQRARAAGASAMREDEDPRPMRLRRQLGRAGRDGADD